MLNSYTKGSFSGHWSTTRDDLTSKQTDNQSNVSLNVLR